MYNGESWTVPQAQKPISCFPQLYRLRCVDLSALRDLKPEVWTIFFLNLRLLSMLEVLNLSGCPLLTASLAPLTTALPQLHILPSFEISSCWLETDSQAPLSTSLSSLTSLTELNLSATNGKMLE